MKIGSIGVKTTFKQLKGKKLKCIQTGEIIKRSKADALRRARAASNRNDFRLNKLKN